MPSTVEKEGMCVRIGLTEDARIKVAGLVAYKMTSSRYPPGGMAVGMRTTMLTSGRMISPYAGPEVVWNGLYLGLGNGSVAVT